MAIPPAVLAGVTLALTAASTAAQMVAQKREADAARARGEYEAAVARNNQIIQERAAADALERGQIAASEKRGEAAQLVGVQRASLAAHGIEVGTGTARDITADTAGIGELDAQRILANAEREAYAHRIGASTAAAEAELARLRGKRSSRLFATALTGASQLAGNFATFQQAGAFDRSLGLRRTTGRPVTMPPSDRPF